MQHNAGCIGKQDFAGGMDNLFIQVFHDRQRLGQQNLIFLHDTAQFSAVQKRYLAGFILSRYAAGNRALPRTNDELRYQSVGNTTLGEKMISRPFDLYQTDKGKLAQVILLNKSC